ncbi:cytochrome c oxidase assembly cox19 [Pyrrhoderma noxium]|uniref:Cytochrome c oxidase assembly protein COX19 n=1 Tax=Pyrrhoderma noxium TaxID=2282107 RepID=A0A286UQF4_9AGAM|nr:cytochrome c oxidase assembly cox19 [Pyrrhoderma noxium]
MSFGRPGSFSEILSSPPDRGSFPLDHYGECKEQMKLYLSCLQKNGATSSPCRLAGKEYLECRMTKGLMERDEWHKLGMNNLTAPNTSGTSTPDQSSNSTSQSKS